MIHKASTERGIIGLTPPSRAEGTARGSERSGGPRVVSKARGRIILYDGAKDVFCMIFLQMKTKKNHTKYAIRDSQLSFSPQYNNAVYSTLKKWRRMDQ
jgi:hypothetical protein